MVWYNFIVIVCVHVCAVYCMIYVCIMWWCVFYGLCVCAHVCSSGAYLWNISGVRYTCMACGECVYVCLQPRVSTPPRAQEGSVARGGVVKLRVTRCESSSTLPMACVTSYWFCFSLSCFSCEHTCFHATFSWLQ